ncbi:hypothetical protein [Galbitalea soli]|uniref:Uncharacterized protein n=1 Tax=Galbitalea soli TaxID=1268042 RepID=A0A7C9PNA6_9MICO|nr:hypothetical protein [Galbitalea soli]NEM91386.1 hypothetical protein [Galbitalea soli]NYJ30077.1 hypothetical protein [Galbitalea soli]
MLNAATSSSPLSPELENEKQALLQDYPGVKLPGPQMVRAVTLDEWPQAHSACLVKAGYPATVTPDGGVQTHVGGKQDEAFQIQTWVCDVQFPLQSKFEKSLNTAQYTALWKYQKGDLAKCLTAHGFTVDSPPSLQTFISTYGRPGSWSPYSNVNGTDAEFTAINKECPQVPDDFYN